MAAVGGSAQPWPGSIFALVNFQRPRIASWACDPPKELTGAWWRRIEFDEPLPPRTDFSVDLQFFDREGMDDEVAMLSTSRVVPSDGMPRED